MKERLLLVLATVALVGWIVGIAGPVPADAAMPLNVAWGPSTAPTLMTVHSHVNPLVTVTNAGTSTWPVGGAQPVQLAYHWNNNDGTVLTFDGLRTSLPSSVGPGQTVTLAVDILSPDTAGSYELRFDMVQGINWFSAAGSPTLDLGVTVSPAPYDVLWGAVQLPSMVARSTVQMPLTVVNVGAQTWQAQGESPVHLSYHWMSSDGSTTITYDGVRSMLPFDVASGKSATIAATVRTPDDAGTYTLVFDMVDEGVTWFSAAQAPTLKLPVVVQLPLLDVTWGSGPATVAQEARSTVTVDLILTNTGSTPWGAAGSNPVRLSYHLFHLDGTLASWDGNRSPLPADVPAGGTVSVSAVVNVPSSTQTYRVVWDLLEEGVTWFSETGAATLTTLLQVSPAHNDVTWVVVPAYLQLHARDVTHVPITITNTGGGVWVSQGASPVRLSYHWFTPQGVAVTWDGDRSVLPHDVLPGQSVTLEASVHAPSTAGSFRLVWDMVHEGATWFSSTGAPTAWTAANVAKPLLDVSWKQLGRPLTSTPARGRFALALNLTNDGSALWSSTGAHPTHISYHWRRADGLSADFDGERTSLPHDVAPGGTVDIEAMIVAPHSPGSYQLVMDNVEEGVAWFSSTGARTLVIPVEVTLPVLDARWLSCSAPATMGVAAVALVPVVVTNTGAQTWAADGPQAVHLSYHWVSAPGATVVLEGFRTPLSAPVLPGGTLTTEMGIAAPAQAGDYLLECDLVREDLGWLADLGSSAEHRSVAVAAGIEPIGRPIAVTATPTEWTDLPTENWHHLASLSFLLGVPLGLAFLGSGSYVSQRWWRRP